MIKGIGVDIVKVTRIETAVRRWGDRFLKRVFTPREIDYCYRCKQPYQRLAARFAAKEAFLKALGTGLTQGMSLREVEVISDGKQSPDLLCKGEAQKKLKGVKKVFLSISHEKDYAVAQVVLVGEP